LETLFTFLTVFSSIWLAAVVAMMLNDVRQVEKLESVIFPISFASISWLFVFLFVV
jgi:branched-subunit amino acid permease